MTNNQQIADSLNSFETKLKSKFCQHVRDTINNYKQRASLNMSKSNYLLAEDNYKKILLKASQHDQCSFDTKSIEEKLSENQHLFRYFKMQKELDSLYTEKDYNALLNKIQHMINFYKNEDLSEQGIYNTTPLTFVKKHKDSELKRHITQWYLEQKKGYKALQVLKTFDQEKTNPNALKELQKAIGKAVARQDINKNISKDYKTHSEDLASGAWYKFFRRSYRSTYRKKAGIFPYFF